MLSLREFGLPLSHFHPQSDLPRTNRTSQATDSGDDAQWQWSAISRTGIAHKPDYSNLNTRPSCWAIHQSL